MQDIQRARILAAVLQACGEGGLRGLSVSWIVGRAGVSRRTFYELFADLEDCLLAAFEHSVARLSELVLPAFEAERRWRDRLRAALLALLEALDQDFTLARLVLVESLAAGPLVRERRQRALVPVVAAIHDGHREMKPGATQPSLVIAEGLAGAVTGVLHTRLLRRDPEPLVRLANPLMSLIVLPYLGPSATRMELRRPVPRAQPATGPPPASAAEEADPLRKLGMRITYRTLRVLHAVANSPGASNRAAGEQAGIADQGQISKLLSRLQGLGLISNDRDAEGKPARGMPNAWRLTELGERLLRLGR